MILSKKQKQIRAEVNASDVLSVEEAVGFLQKYASTKFVETVDVVIKLGIDPKRSDQNVRGATVLAHNIGKALRVAVYATDENLVRKAKEAGADLVGGEDLYRDILVGKLEFDILITTPSSMKDLVKLGQILGPKGLMPNPKVGTVSDDLVGAIKNAKSGRVQFKSEKNGLIHCAIGKMNFTSQQVKDNLDALLVAIKRLRPTTAKGVFVKKVVLSSTMGPGLVVNIQ